MEKNQFKNICLCCLTEEDHMKNMQDERFASTLVKVQLIEGYKTCSGITLDKIEEHELSDTKMICCTCEQKLQSSIEFRQLCRKSYQTLKKKANFNPNLYVNVKHEVQSDAEEDSARVKAETDVLFTEVYIKDESSDCTSSKSKRNKKQLKRKKTDTNAKEAVRAPSDVEASDLESDFVCLRCDIVLPTHREYQKHFNQHKSGRGIPRIHKVCDICQVFTKKYVQHIFDQHKDFKPYKCKYCVKNFQTPGRLRLHLTSHTVSKGTVHECVSCHEQFKRNDSLRMHISNHRNPNNEYFCPYCGETFTEFSTLSEHFFSKHDITKTKNLYPCFRCKRIYMVGRYFDSHECSGEEMPAKKSKTENPVICERCSVTFSSQDEYVCHQFLGCRETQPHYCAICDKTFLTKNRLQKHVNASHVPKMKAFICDICGHGSVDKTRYDIHKSSHETERKFRCHYTGCKAAFKHNTLLKSHIKQHEKVNTYECDLCQKRFPFYALIKRHLASSHSNSSEFRSFACEICGKRSISAAALLKHKIAHTGERSVKCQACPKKFSDTSAKNLHYRLSHEGQHWQCKYCEVICKSAVAFKQHLFVHRGFYPFNCPLCAAHYADKYLFKRHLRNQHKITYDENVHGYVEKENLDGIVKECERKNCPDLENVGPQEANETVGN